MWKKERITIIDVRGWIMVRDQTVGTTKLEFFTLGLVVGVLIIQIGGGDTWVSFFHFRRSCELSLRYCVFLSFFSDRAKDVGERAFEVQQTSIYDVTNATLPELYLVS